MANGIKNLSPKPRGAALLIVLVGLLVLIAIGASMLKKSSTHREGSAAENAKKILEIEAMSLTREIHSCLKNKVREWTDGVEGVDLQAVLRCHTPRSRQVYSMVCRGQGSDILTTCDNQRIFPKYFTLSLDYEGPKGGRFRIVQDLSVSPSSLKDYAIFILAQPSSLTLGEGIYDGKYSLNLAKDSLGNFVGTVTLDPGADGTLDFRKLVETNVPEGSHWTIAGGREDQVHYREGINYGSSQTNVNDLVYNLGALIDDLNTIKGDPGNNNANSGLLQFQDDCSVKVSEDYGAGPVEIYSGTPSGVAIYLRGNVVRVGASPNSTGSTGTKFAACGNFTLITDNNIQIHTPIVKRASGANSIANAFVSLNGNIRIPNEGVYPTLDMDGNQLKNANYGDPTKIGFQVDASLVAPIGTVIDISAFSGTTSNMGKLKLNGSLIAGSLAPYGMVFNGSHRGFNSRSASFDPVVQNFSPPGMTIGVSEMYATVISQTIHYATLEEAIAALPP